jgi:hypothetical protein
MIKEIFICNDLILIENRRFLKIENIENNFSDMRTGRITLKNGKSIKVKLIHIKQTLWVSLGDSFNAVNLNDKVEGILTYKEYATLNKIPNDIVNAFNEAQLDLNAIPKRELRQTILFILESNSITTRIGRIKAFVESYRK